MIPAAERAACDILRNAGLVAHVTPPARAAPPYLRVARVGGTMHNLVTDAPLLTVSAYGNGAFEASELANRAREALLAARCSWAGDVWVRWWQEAAGPANYPDPDAERLVRYQFSGVLMVATNTKTTTPPATRPGATPS